MVGIHEKKSFAMYEKTTENHPLDLAKKIGGNVSLSHAVAQNRVEGVQMNITHKRKSLYFK